VFLRRIEQYNNPEGWSGVPILSALLRRVLLGGIEESNSNRMKLKDPVVAARWLL
jgi:hypothetical protein